VNLKNHTSKFKIVLLFTLSSASLTNKLEMASWFTNLRSSVSWSPFLSMKCKGRIPFYYPQTCCSILSHVWTTFILSTWEANPPKLFQLVQYFNFTPNEIFLFCFCTYELSFKFEFLQGDKAAMSLNVIFGCHWINNHLILDLYSLILLYTLENNLSVQLFFPFWMRCWYRLS